MTNDRAAAALAGIQRLSGLPAGQLDVTIRPADADAFAASTSGGRLRIEATTPAVALAGYAQLARRTRIGSVSRSGVRRPTALPDGASVAASSPYQRRVAYNLTVGGYTTPFFGWDEWEHELDLLAASGINAAHITLGQEAVWLQAFQQFGYTETELLQWIVPPSHQAWQWLNNIEHFGSGTTRGIVERRVELAHRVFARMAELEITPILPGFSGTVPPGFAERNPGAAIVPQGLWFIDIAGPRRPDWLRTDTADYAKAAAAFYGTQRDLFGLSGWWAVDLLHEGGKIGDTTLAAAARGVEDAMRTADAGYTWVVQGWGGNPQPELLDALDTSRLLVIDLVGEHWRTMNGYGGTPWVYGILPNYGGRHGLYGDLEAIAATPATLFGGTEAVGNVVGITDMAEGVANNPVVWDLFHDLAWTTEPIDLDAWLDEWVEARYGRSTEGATAAWRVLRAHAYGPWRVDETAPTPKESTLVGTGQPVDIAALDATSVPDVLGAAVAEAGDTLDAFVVYAGTDSVVAAVPSLGANQASMVGPRVLPYPAGALRPALAGLIAAAEAGRSPSLDYDLVDVARQVLADHARLVLARIGAAVEAGDTGAFDAATATFLELVDLQDATLHAHPAFRLETWLAGARALGATARERADLAEWGRRLLTSWGARESTMLTEYGNRDWSGLVGGYYRQRWALWFQQLRNVLTGAPTTPIDWYAVADAWVSDDQPLAERPATDVLEQAKAALTFVTSRPDGT
ncbi:alpha-N-acetylglucosaminidase [Jiangella alba]|uniref:Alpha-N-acetylglucosaminidase (NAGLU) C-terminal domain-containing protein n=1 Tax=Jiangella alba TaxID=561176 RepID=A0A1H5PYY1_9ACTN|nr:alpha-N-acetylglucosaminidase [Jiangella alba]SEF18909.1 Alpha-N-acetylglucosaminidase (NAGLU) C-terminal domain-containing protein [Jiangella alba]